MKNKAVSGIMLTLLLMSMLLGAFETIETVHAESSPNVTFDLTYYYPDGYVHGVSPGEIVAVDVYVDASALTNNSPEGMRGWGLYVIFDPNVLEPYYYLGNPAYAYTSAAGYFLYEWSKTNWPPPPFPPGAPIPYPPTFLKANGTDYIVCTENFLGLPPDMGAGGTGKLCTLYFQSKSLTAYSPIIIVTEDLKSGYADATGAHFPINAMNGHYNQPSYIYIRADGSVEPDTAPISSADNITYTFTDNIFGSIIVERDNIVVEGAGYVLQGGIAGIDLSGRNNITIKNVEIKAFYHGILLCGSSSNTVSGNNITANNGYGIIFDGSSSNTISGNNITANKSSGIGLLSSSNNTISGNNITANKSSGIRLSSSSNNTVSGNNIANNEYGILLSSSSNNTISGNNITANSYYGIRLSSSSNNAFGNNDVSNNKYNFGVYGSSLSTYIHNIDDSNTVNGKPVHYWVTKRDMTVPLDAGYVALINCTRITTKNLNLTNNVQGVLLAYTTNSTITKNNIANNEYGIRLWSSSNNAVSGNNIANNWRGISLYGSSDNTVYHNNFVDNTGQVSGYYSTNVWDDGYPSGGNFWSDHVTVDDCCGVNQDEPGSDGIVDEPYVIDENNCDNYPLVEPWSPVVSASVEIDPDILNMRSREKWITACIQLPEEYNAEDIDATTILLNGTISPVLDPMYEFVTNSSEYLVDHDEDGILERMVKFDKAEVMDLLDVGEATLTITGEVNGTSFEGSDTIRVR